MILIGATGGPAVGTAICVGRKKMSEYVKIKRRLYDELVETKAKYAVLCEMIEALKKVYEENRPKGEEDETD